MEKNRTIVNFFYKARLSQLGAVKAPPCGKPNFSLSAMDSIHLCLPVYLRVSGNEETLLMDLQSLCRVFWMAANMAVIQDLVKKHGDLYCKYYCS